jgi:hypothetical protein
VSAVRKRVLALDLSTRAGWAFGCDFSPPRHGVWALPQETGGIGKRMSAFAAALEDAIAVMAPDLIVAEAPLPPQAQTAMASARIQFGLAAVCEMIAHERTVPCEEASAWEVRRLVFGKARVPKETVIAWCRERGLSPVDDNDADALALLHYRHLLFRTRVMAGSGSA